MKKLIITLLFIPLISLAQENVINSYENMKYLGNKLIYNGKPYNGVVEIYYKNGILEKKHIYKDGLEHGLCEWYYENGNLYMKKNYKYGKVDGIFVAYTQNGNFIFKRNYKYGKEDGYQESYNNNGQLITKTFYEMGIKSGPFEQYFDSGQLFAKINYKDDEYDGWAEKYYENGELEGKAYWKNGVRIDIGGVNIEDVNVYDLEAMIRLFLKDCEQNNIKLMNDYKITSTFETLDKGVVALSSGIFNDKEIIIKVSPQEWSKASNPKKWYILYHELGHDVLNLQHGQGGKMMFNFTEEDYTWDDFFKDKDYMLNSTKKIK